MKKIITTISAIVLSVLIGLSTLAGCNIVTTDTERDLAQVVATVNIGNENQDTETIYKKDLTMAYMSYGYYYVYYQGYSNAQVFEMIIENLVNNRILVQNAMKEFEEKALIENSSFDKWNLDRYLDSEELTNATYNAIKSVNDLIDGYETNDEVKVGDTLVEEVRTIPTDAANDTEVSLEEKEDYVTAGILTGSGSDDRRKAYNKVLRLLKNSGLLGEDFASSLTESQYYKDLLKSEKEAALLEKYDEYVKKGYREAITFETLSSKYAEMYDAQVKGYSDNKTNFESAISSYAAKSPIVYSPFSGYGFVYNLLLGASAEQTELINEKKAEITDNDAFRQARREILQSTTAKDLRSTWIQSGYDLEFNSNDEVIFTGDYTFAKDKANSLTFKGEVSVLKEKTDKESAEYRVDSLVEYGLDGFLSMMDKYIYGSEMAGEIGSFDASIYKKVNSNVDCEEYENKINELLFAFSTDGGSLNTYKGYSIAPKPDNAGNEKYVQEFADAARELLDMGKSSYIVVGTDYGYHIMFFSQVLGANVNYPTLVEYLNSVSGLSEDATYWENKYLEVLENYEDAEEDDYLYILSGLCSNADTLLNNKKDQIVKSYKYDKDHVVYNESAYQDLLKL